MLLAASSLQGLALVFILSSSQTLWTTIVLRRIPRHHDRCQHGGDFGGHFVSSTMREGLVGTTKYPLALTSILMRTHDAQIRKITPCPRHTRKSFIISRIGHSIGYFLLLDLSWTYARYSPVYAHPGSYKMIPRTPHDFLLHAITSLLWAAGVIAPLSLQYTLLATFCVAIGLTEPSEWPPVVGNFSDAYSLRNFWGYGI
jgi:hypothetical protein